MKKTEVSPAELSELFIRGFELADEMKRAKLLEKVQFKWCDLRLEREILLAVLIDKSTLVFTKQVGNREYILSAEFLEGHVISEGLYWTLHEIVADALHYVHRATKEFDVCMLGIDSFERRRR